jgi:hypothetical protein
MGVSHPAAEREEDARTLIHARGEVNVFMSRSSDALQ